VWPREDAHAVRADANLAQIWARDGSGRTRRSECVAALGRALATRRSGRTSSDTREHDASARERCPQLSDLVLRRHHFMDITAAATTLL
jgi:hypothetical protein